VLPGPEEALPRKLSQNLQLFRENTALPVFQILKNFTTFWSLFFAVDFKTMSQFFSNIISVSLFISLNTCEKRFRNFSASFG
jgi:hypothetical protein